MRSPHRPDRPAGASLRCGVSETGYRMRARVRAAAWSASFVKARTRCATRQTGQLRPDTVESWDNWGRHWRRSA